MTLNVGMCAPDFTLMNDEGHLISLHDFKGQNVILYFYPKDDTSGCTAQACQLRDLFPHFSSTNAIVLGISKDTLEQHKKFKQKYNLPFSLLVDDKTTVCQQYDVWAEKTMYGRKYFGIERTTFLIDTQGIIRHIWPKVKVPGHGEDVLKVLQQIGSS